MTLFTVLTFVFVGKANAIFWNDNVGQEELSSEDVFLRVRQDKICKIVCSFKIHKDIRLRFASCKCGSENDSSSDDSSEYSDDSSDSSDSDSDDSSDSSSSDESGEAKPPKKYGISEKTKGIGNKGKPKHKNRKTKKPKKNTTKI